VEAQFLVDRIHTGRSPTSVNISGTLGNSLFHHAMERCRHFLLYLFFFKALVDRLNTNHGQSFATNKGVSLVATHQVDAGLRSND
jgi:hypothetical protein